MSSQVAPSPERGEQAEARRGSIAWGKRRTVEVVILWIVPLVALVAGGLFWGSRGPEGWAFFGYLVGVPLVFGYAVVVPATGPCRLWAWRTQYSFSGTVLPSIGVLWAGYANLAFLLASSHVTAGSRGAQAAASVAAIALTFMVVCVLVDILSMEAGLLEVYNRAHKQGLSTVQSVSSYGFWFFGSIGVFMGVAARIGYHVLVGQHQAERVLSLGLIVAAAVSAPYLAWVLMTDRKRRLRAKRRSHASRADGAGTARAA